MGSLCASPTPPGVLPPTPASQQAEELFGVGQWINLRSSEAKKEDLQVPHERGWIDEK